MTKEQHIEAFNNTLLMNYDMPEEFTKGLSEFLYDEGYRLETEGKWESVEEENFWVHNMEESLLTGKPTKANMPRCSCCKKVFGTIAFDFKFCPECGAKIIGHVNKEN